MPSTSNAPSMRVCAIDIGTNSARYMIADLDRQSGRITVIFQGGRVTRLGAGIGRGKVTTGTAAKTTEAVREFYAHALNLAVSGFKIFGTAALREASDSDTFSRSIKDLTGEMLEIIDADQEARMLEGAIAHSLRLADTAFIAVDVGGGSAQMVVHHATGPSRHFSLPLGAVRLTEQFLSHDPPSPGELSALRDYVGRLIEKSELPTHNGGSGIFIGAGGTATTVAAMIKQLRVYDHSKIHGSKITREQWQSLLLSLSAIPTAGRLGQPGLQGGREDIIVAGIIALDALAAYANAKEMLVSDRGVLYGSLVQVLEEMKS